MNPSVRNKQIALTWISAFNEHDLEKLLGLYSDDAVHLSPKLKIRNPETKGLISGKPALMQWWADAFDRLPSLRYKLQNLVINEDQVLMEYLRQVNNEPDMMVAEILEIKDDLIVRSRVYHG
ncbi:MAG: nuclear transport factor 2 family protein [Ferruginibacter sp.]